MSLNRRHLLAGLAVTGLMAQAAQARAATADKTVPLWPHEPPNGTGVTAHETVTETREKPDQPNRTIAGVRVPDLAIRYPAVPNGSAILIMPGGGFRNLAYDKEGTEIAAWLLSLGFVTGVLKYRLPSDGWSAGPDVAVQDAERAMRLLRQEVPGGKVGVMGFSAGGYLGAALATRFAENLDGTIDAASNLSARPDFAALIYPALAVADIHAPSLLDKVTAQSSPAFIVHAADDPRASPAASVAFAGALLAQKVPTELHLFQTGGHGFALRRPPAAEWPGLFDIWAKARLKA